MSDPASELPVLSSDPICPAALPIAGADRSSAGVVCRIMQRENEDDPGLRMSAGALGRVRGSSGGVFLNLRSDPSTVTGFCHGPALPRSCEADEGPRAHHTFCPVWEAEVERIRAGREELLVEDEPEAVSMGIEPVGMDPWTAARSGLDELSPIGERS